MISERISWEWFLACNSYQIIDLGVMVDAQKIIDEAVKNKVDIIGLSGLITPSLDEMVNVASEMERQGLKIPLLIGGATTSRIHTAVKIDPVYSGTVVHVTDASKSVPIAGEAISEETKEAYHRQIKETYQQLREEHEAKQSVKQLISYEEAKANPVAIDWADYEPVKPKVLGKTVLEDLDLSTLIKYIDWTPFFSTWMLSGRFPKILEDPIVGSEAKKLYADAQAMLDQIIAEKWLSAKAVFSLLPVRREGDDAVAFDPKNESLTLGQFHFFASAREKRKRRSEPLAGRLPTPGKARLLGMFCGDGRFGNGIKIG